MKVARNKLTTIIVSIMLIISLFATNVATVFAADGMASTVSTSLISAERCEYDYVEGQLMSYTVGYSGEAFGSFQLTISGLNNLRDVEICKDFEYSNENDMFMSEFDKENGILTANFSSAYSQNTYGGLLTVYFTVEQPEYNIELYPNLDNVAFYDEEVNEIPVRSKLGEIIISVNTEAPDNEIKGDVDGDEMVTLQDLLIIQRSLLGSTYLNDTQYYLADVNSDGMVDIRDCQYIQQYLVGKITSFDQIGGNGGGDETKMYHLSVEVYDTNRNYLTSTGINVSSDENILSTLMMFAKRNGFEPIAAYYNYDMTDEISNGTCAGSDMTVFVVVEANDSEGTNEYTIYLQSFDTDGNYLGSTDFIISGNESILNKLNALAEQNGYSLVAAYYDSAMTKQITYEDCAKEDMDIYAVAKSKGGYEGGEGQYYYIDVMGMVKFFGGEYMPMESYHELRVSEGDNLAQIAKNEISDYYEIVGIYYDMAMTQVVAESDVYTAGINQIFVKLETKDISGTYDVYNVRISMEGKQFYELAGSAELFANGSATLTMGSEIRTATYAFMGGGMIMDLDVYEQYQMSLYDYNDDGTYEIMIDGYFNGSENEVTEEYQAVEGSYSVDMDGIILELELMNNGVFIMGGGDFYVKGGYEITDNGIALTMTGSTMPFIYDEKTNTFTPDYNGGGNGEAPNPDVSKQYYLEYQAYMKQPNGETLPMGRTASYGGIAGTNLYSGALNFCQSMPDEYSLVGVYYDSEFSIEVGTEDVLGGDTTIYILVETSFAGCYNVLSMEYSEDGTMTTEVIGKIELTDDGSAKGQINATMIEGTYSYFNGMCLVNVSQYEQYMLGENGTDLILYSFFDGSDYPEQEELVKWAGDYVVLEEHKTSEGITYEEHHLTLYSNGVYNLANYGIVFVGSYSMDGNVVLLDQMGSTARAEYDEERGCFIAIVEGSYPEQNPEGGSTVISYAYADGDVIYTVEIHDDAIYVYDNMYHKYACHIIDANEEGIIAYYSDSEGFKIVFDENKEYITYMEKVSTSNSGNSGIIDSGIIKNENLI